MPRLEHRTHLTTKILMHACGSTLQTVHSLSRNAHIIQVSVCFCGVGVCACVCVLCVYVCLWVSLCVCLCAPACCARARVRVCVRTRVCVCFCVCFCVHVVVCVSLSKHAGGWGGAGGRAGGRECNLQARTPMKTGENDSDKGKGEQVTSGGNIQNNRSGPSIVLLDLGCQHLFIDQPRPRPGYGWGYKLARCANPRGEPLGLEGEEESNGATEPERNDTQTERKMADVCTSSVSPDSRVDMQNGPPLTEPTVN